MFKRLDPYGNGSVGVYVRATATHLFVPPGLTEQNVADFEEAFSLPSTPLTLGGSTLLGSLMAANSHGALVADSASDAEVAILKDAGLNVQRLQHARLNATGNNILVNDHAALAHPELSKKTLALIEDTLGVPVAQRAIADVPTVGTACVATNNGFMAHPLASEDDIAFLKDHFGVNGRIGTVNHGHGFVGAGMAANQTGVVTGTKTTGIELGRIEEALGFLETET